MFSSDLRILLFTIYSSLIQCASCFAQEDDVVYCGIVLHDMEGYLASDFCSSFASIEDATIFVTETSGSEVTAASFSGGTSTAAQPTTIM